MDINDEVKRKISKIQDIFREEVSKMHEKIITGSPVDTGRFKTSWQLLEFDPTKLKFHLYNPVEYGLKLWRYKGSNQGWSPSGGDRIIDEFVDNLQARLREL